MQLYSYFRSSASYRVRIALALKRLDYDYLPVHLVKNEQLAPAFRAVAPAQLVPVLVVDDDGRARPRDHAVAGDHRVPRRDASRAAAAARPTRSAAPECARSRSTSPARSIRSTTCACCATCQRDLKVCRRRQEPLVPALGRDRSRGRRAPARRPSPPPAASAMATRRASPTACSCRRSSTPGGWIAGSTTCRR